MRWRIVTLHFKFETTSKVLGNFAHSVSWNISELLSFKVFLILSLPHKVFSLQLFSFIRPLSSPSLSFPHCFCRISWTVMMSAVLVRYLFLVTPFTLNLSFTFSIIIFHFFAILSPLLASSLFWLFILWKVLWVYLWEKGGSTGTLLLWTEYLQHSDQSLIDLKKWCNWSSIMMHDLHLLFNSYLWPQEQVLSFTLCNYSELLQQVFIGRTDVEAETPVLWPPDAKSWLIWKDPDAGKDWGQEEKGMTEDVMVGWHHRLDGYGFGWTPGVGDGQGGLACCGSWGCKESDTTDWLTWTDYNRVNEIWTLLLGDFLFF